MSGSGPSSGAPAGGVQFLPPDRTLQLRAAAPGGLSREEAVARANKVIESLAPEYRQQLRVDVDALAKLEPGLSLGGEVTRLAVERMWRAAHELRGLGGTFDYPLITEISDSLCRCLRLVDPNNPKFLSAVSVHLGGLKLILDRDVRGYGGAAERGLLASLHKAVAHITDPDRVTAEKAAAAEQ